jgi:hypothetical protein
MTSVTIFGGIVGGVLGFGLGHLIGRKLRRNTRAFVGLNRDQAYILKLESLLILIKRLIKQKVDLRTFIAVLEKVVNEFRPAFLLELHHTKLRQLVSELAKFLARSSVHTALLDSVVQLKHGLKSNVFTSLICKRLRAFYIPLYHLLKKPKHSEDNQQLEFVMRLSHILSSSRVKEILSQHSFYEECLIDYLIPYPSLLYAYTENKSNCISLLTELEGYLNTTSKKSKREHRLQKRMLKDRLILRRHSLPSERSRDFKYAVNSKDKFREKLIKLLVKTNHTFHQQIIPTSDDANNSYEVAPSPIPEVVINSPVKRNTYISKIPLYIENVNVITEVPPPIYDGDMQQLEAADSDPENEAHEATSRSVISQSPSYRQDSSSILTSSPCKAPSIHEEDMRDSITELKPPVIEEVQIVVHKFQHCFDELLSIEKEPSCEKIWRQVVDKPDTKVYQKKLSNSPMCIIKAFCTVPYSGDIVFKAIWDTTIRTKWDQLFLQFEIIDKTPDYELLYYMIKTPIGLTRRDWLQRRIFIRDYPAPGDICMHFISVESPLKPPVPKVIRAETVISGYIIRPGPNDTCTVTIITQNDIKGLIPTSIVNRVASKAPADWVKNMMKGCKMAIEMSKN